MHAEMLVHALDVTLNVIQGPRHLAAPGLDIAGEALKVLRQFWSAPRAPPLSWWAKFGSGGVRRVE
jgi:hypothetical protein